jgi:hypothetical protein
MFNARLVFRLRSLLLRPSVLRFCLDVLPPLYPATRNTKSLLVSSCHDEKPIFEASFKILEDRYAAHTKFGTILDMKE